MQENSEAQEVLQKVYDSGYINCLEKTIQILKQNNTLTIEEITQAFESSLEQINNRFALAYRDVLKKTWPFDD